MFKRKSLSFVLLFLFVLQLFPINFAFAVDNGVEDITGKSEYLTIHGSDYMPQDRASSFEITAADGVTVISPNPDGSYSNIPAGAKVQLDFVFSLSDGDENNLYTYTGDEYFTATLPSGVSFNLTSGKIVAEDTTNGLYELAEFNIQENTLMISLTNDSEDTTNKGGAANPMHLDKWGKLHIEGEFEPLNAGDSTDTSITFGSEEIIIHRQPLPMKSTLEKVGTFDASSNCITWQVTITPPAGDPNLAYDTYSVIDAFDSNQTYVSDSFSLGSVSINDSDANLTIDESSRTITYVFPDTDPDTTGIQTITYQTEPTTFADETGSPTFSTFENTVNLQRNGETIADPVTAAVQLDWINKTGIMSTTADDSTIVKWTINITIPGEAGKTIDNAKIIDIINSNLELLNDNDHPISMTQGNASTNVTEGAAPGNYTYEDNEFIYTFPLDAKPTAGTNSTLTFYTKVKDTMKDDYLNDNGKIAFDNNAKLTWSEITVITKAPSHSATVGNGIPAGGLLSKAALGGSPNYTYVDKDIIEWRITVNRNQIAMIQPEITDTIAPNQMLLIDDTHPFTATKNGDPTPTVTLTSTDSSHGFVYDATTDPNEFSFFISDALHLDGIIQDTIYINYYTKIVDHSSLYTNGNINFNNTVLLTRLGETDIPYNGVKALNSQMLQKSVITNYDYVNHILQWKIEVNRNKLPLNNAVLTDTLPDGMHLFIDDTHPFEITPNIGGDTGSHTAITEADTFTLTLPTTTSDQYTIKFWAKLTDNTLKTQWNGTKNFKNIASLTADEINNPISHSYTAKIKNPIISKTYSYTNNSDTIHWSAVINPAQMSLTNAVITDVLHADLKLEDNTVKLYTITIDSSSGQYDTSAAKVLVDSSDYSATYENNTLEIALPQNTNKAYLLEFSTIILVDDINLSNQIELTGGLSDPAGTNTSDSVSVTDLYSQGGSGSNSLTVHKTDKEGNPLQGATFRLVNSNMQPIRRDNNEISQTTDANGNATFTNLPSWVFYVEETTPSEGYLLDSDPFYGGTRLNGAETITVENCLALTNVSFDKTGADGALISGGTFTLTGKDYKNDNVSMTASAVNGKVQFIDVPPNKSGEPYIIQETVAPLGHETTSQQISATVVYNDDKTGLDVNLSDTDLENIPHKTTVSFSKLGINGQLLTGGSFKLTGTDYLNNAITKTTVAVNGQVSFEDIPIGNYSITEEDSPVGYLMPVDQTILTVTVQYNNDNSGLEVKIYNTDQDPFEVASYTNTKALGQVSFTKMDEATNAHLSGGSFNLTGIDYEGNPIDMTAESIGGTVTFTDIPLNNEGGFYTIKELRAPSGYLTTNKKLTATVTYDGADKTKVKSTISNDSLTNERKSDRLDYAEISVIKTNEDGARLQGAEFTLYDSSNEIIATAISNQDGVAYFGSIVEASNYTIKETKAPQGYDINNESIDFSIYTAHAKSFTIVNKKSEAKPGLIRIIKLSQDGEVLAGAEFSLYTEDGEEVETVITQDDGTALFKNVIPGLYTLEETRPPSGYILNSDIVSVQILDGDTIELTFTNNKMVEIDPIDPENENVPSSPTDSSLLTDELQILKINQSGAPLEGAEFTLYNTDNEIITTSKTDTNGIVLFKDIAPGTYYVKETIAPNGYIVFDEPLEIQIGTDGILHSYTLRNTTNEADVAGWSDTNDGTLPKTGGISPSFFILFTGFGCILVGILLANARYEPKRLKNKH